MGCILSLPGEGRPSPEPPPKGLVVSGHSKWSSIKHKKAIVDSRRGAAFTKLARAVTVAAREGGGDPDSNAALENAIRKAKAASMPKDNIERAIAKGTGEGGDGEALETVIYEGYGPAGVALLVETVTDNRNRTGPDVRNLFTKYGGSLGEPGSVAYLFEKKGVIIVDASRYTEDDLLAAVEAGAEDISEDEDVFEVITPLTDFTAVRRALEEAGVELEGAELTYRPSSLVPIEHEGQVVKLMKLIDGAGRERRRLRGARQLRCAGRHARAGRWISHPSRSSAADAARGCASAPARYPKPLIEIGGRPIVQHVIELYAAQGFRRFLLATGYRGELIERFVAERGWPHGVEVQCVDSGLDTPTGGRIKHLEGLLADEPTFCVTYADGLADIDLARLLRFHKAHGAHATITVVRPELQFGVAELDGEDGRVLGFREKPRSEHWINGGFLCLAPAAFDYLAHDSVLEREPLQRLAADDQLRAYRHEGFWECMDTYKDAVALNDLWASGSAPWRAKSVV